MGCLCADRHCTPAADGAWQAGAPSPEYGSAPDSHCMLGPERDCYSGFVGCESSESEGCPDIELGKRVM